MEKKIPEKSHTETMLYIDTENQRLRRAMKLTKTIPRGGEKTIFSLFFFSARNTESVEMHCDTSEAGC